MRCRQHLLHCDIEGEQWLSRFLQVRRIGKLLFEWMLRIANDGSLLQIADNIEEAQELLRPPSKDGIIVREDVLSIIASQVSVNLMIASIHYSLVVASMVKILAHSKVINARVFIHLFYVSFRLRCRVLQALRKVAFLMVQIVCAR